MLICFSDYWNLGDYCREKKSEYKAKGIFSLHAGDIRTTTELLSEQSFNDRNIIVEWIKYKRQCFDVVKTPKIVIRAYCDANRIPLPTYETNMVDQQFYSIIKLQDKQYTSVIWHRNKKMAEQAAALVCGFQLGLYDEAFLLSIGCLISR